MSTASIILRLAALIGLVFLLIYLVHLNHKKESEGMKAFEVKLNKDTTVRANFRKDEYEGTKPVTRQDIYGKHLVWDFKTKTVTWWYVGSPNDKRTAPIIPLNK